MSKADPPSGTSSRGESTAEVRGDTTSMFAKALPIDDLRVAPCGCSLRQSGTVVGIGSPFLDTQTIRCIATQNS